MRKLITFIAAVAVTFMAFPASAQANPYYNEYFTTLPEWVTSDTPFTVTVDGPYAVCQMEFGNQVSPWGGPYTFVYKVNSDVDELKIIMCNEEEGTEREWLNNKIPFVPESRFVGASEWENSNEFTVSNRTNEPMTLTVLDKKGATVKSVSQDPGGETRGTLSIDIPKGDDTKYTVVASTPSGLSMPFKVIVAKGWTLMTEQQLFENCSTVPWYYDNSGKPAKTDKGKVLSDLRGAFDRLGKVTGLKFVQSEDPAIAFTPGTITIGWQNQGKNGPAATGGYSYSSSSGSYGDVDINTKNWWSTSDSLSGFGKTSRGPGGRGWLFIHEIMHSLGLGHVENPKAIMAPLNRGQHKFTKGDLAGLDALYPKSECAV